MVGSLWVIGYVVAPALFSFLQNDNLAGEIAGQMFHLASAIVLISGLVLILSVAIASGSNWFRDKRVHLIFLMLIGMSVVEFVLNPMVQKARDTDAFGPLHGASAVLYLLISGLGLLLVVVWDTASFKEGNQ